MSEETPDTCLLEPEQEEETIGKKRKRINWVPWDQFVEEHCVVRGTE